MPANGKWDLIRRLKVKSAKNKFILKASNDDRPF